LGTYISNPGSATSNRTCAECQKPGFYNATTTNAPTSDACIAWSTCPTGTFISTPGSTTVNQACTPCAAGNYNDAPNQTSCKAHKICPPGTMVSSAGSATTDKGCTACTGGFSTTSDALACTPFTKCTIGKILTDGSATADAVCAQCPTGTKSTNPISHDCVPI
jgi:hypothetical protein